MKTWKIEFKIKKDIKWLFDYSPYFNAKYENGELEVSIQYDFNNQPISLRSKCYVGDDVVVNNFNYRLELYINGIIADEEWPCGDNFISKKMLLELGAQPLYNENNSMLLKTGFCIQNWKPQDNVFVGDCMPFVDRDTFHIFYLKDRHHHTSKWNLGAHQWAHIKSNNLIDWQECPMAIEIDNKKEGSICTGSVIKYNNQYLAYYAVRMSDQSPAQITFSESADCINFKKSNEIFTVPLPYHATSARDPKIYVDSEGTLNILITTSYIADDNNKGCLARAKFIDGKWIFTEPIVVLDIEDQPECSDYFEFNGYYYLVYSNYGYANYYYSQNPNGPFVLSKKGEIRYNNFRVPKAAIFNNRLFFVGWVPENGLVVMQSFA